MTRVRMSAVGAAFALFAGAAQAQMVVELRVPSSMFLEMEPAVVTVTIRNQSGDPFTLGGTNTVNRLYLDIERGTGERVRPTGENLIPEEITIPSRGYRQFQINMCEFYQLTRSGPHAVTARLNVGENRFISDRYLFDVVPGFEIRRIEARTRGNPPRTIVLLLKSLVRDREERLFLRIDEPKAELCLGVYNLGTLVRVFEPQMAIDAENRVHVLHQSAPQRFTHSVFELTGSPVSTTYYGGLVSDARLVSDEDGFVEVLGVVPYEGDPYASPLRAQPQVWQPPAPPITPKKTPTPHK